MLERSCRYVRPGWAAPTLFLFLSGPVACAETSVPVRASSVALLGEQKSAIHIARPSAEVIPVLESLFSTRGFHVIAQYKAMDGSADELYAFKGQRQSVILGEVHTTQRRVPGTFRTASDTSGEIATYQLGSSFYAAVRASGAAVDILLLGKPMLNGQELCSDADALLRRFDYWCIDSKLANGEALLPSLRGREEADVVGGVLLQLGQRFPDAK